MSYILDALRKADAERARGSVPRLHTQPVAGAGAAGNAPRGARWRWATLAALAGLLGALGWWAGRESAPLPELEARVPVEEPASLSPPVLLPAPLQVPLQVPSQVPSQVQSQVPSPAAPAPRATITLPTPTPRPALPASAAVASASPPAASRVPLLTELPADLRRQLPALALGGSVYSDRPASRFVMINGQILREGDTVAPGLLLEGLRPKSAVFTFRGQRFEVPY